jgi:hypothetical protein
MCLNIVNKMLQVGRCFVFGKWCKSNMYISIICFPHSSYFTTYNNPSFLIYKFNIPNAFNGNKGRVMGILVG